MADTNTRQGKRTPVTLKIKFKSETIEQFIERYAVDVSQGGIFIRTKEPLAVGTQMKFEFQLRDASPLIAGEGTVVWTRENDPSRPAIAPGMGVRFDRLADGSQSVLEKILAEKAKQAPSRSGNQTAPGDSAKAAMFTDTPTRVAPAAVQEALGMRGRRADSEQTPLPKPMPFHSDADDFDDRAFEEATKVRSLDELVAENAALGDQLSEDAKTATKIMPADELAVRRHAGRADSTIADPPMDAPPPESRGGVPTYSMPDRDSAPGLPSPPAVEPSRQRQDSTPARTSRPPTNPGMGPAAQRAATPSQSPTGDGGRTQLGLGAPKVSSQPSMPRMAAATDTAAPRAAVAKESSRPVAPSRPSSAPIILGLLLVVGAVIGAVYWFVLRDPGGEKVVTNPATGSGSAVATGSDSATATGSGSATATGSDAVGSAGAMSGSGSAVAMGSNAGSGSAATMAGSGSAAVPAVATVDTVISAAAKGASIEIVGTELKGPSPLTAKLEKDKVYKARVSAAGFAMSEIDVKGGERATAKLVLKPRVVSVTTDPPGASIYVDSVDTGKLSPSDITLTAAQAGRPRVRISMRRSGFRPVDMSVDASTFKDEGATMTNTVEAKLVVQAVVRPPTGGGTGSATPTGAGSGSATTTPPTGTGTQSTTTPPAGTGTGSATPTKPSEPSMSPGAGTMPTELK